LYTGDNLKDAAGKNGTHIGSRSGVCFETEFPPDSPNGRYSDMCVLRAGKKYEHFTSFEFGNI
ncbi:MAG: galactose mutarotase, partial [Candidatus Methanomethylophilaceae archaeon]|nr:galactose mutarotase [Candidatus Methanomethylophilaceae archaeon]